MLPAHLVVSGAEARSTAYVLHGILGAGHNFRSFVGRLAIQRPEWRFILVDLRHHGRSQGAPAPNTLKACVGDLLELSAELQVVPEVMIGHSFGGKVALAYGRELIQKSAPPYLAPAQAALRQIWALDSDPGAQKPSSDHEVLRVLSALRATPGPFATRQQAVLALTKQRGIGTGVAQWLATRLERRDDQVFWRFDLDAIEQLLDDYFREDLWTYLEALRGAVEHHLVVAERSERWTGPMRQRVGSLPRDTPIVLHELPDAGHWVHVDNPDGLLRIFTEHLRAGP